MPGMLAAMAPRRCSDSRSAASVALRAVMSRPMATNRRCPSSRTSLVDSSSAKVVPSLRRPVSSRGPPPTNPPDPSSMSPHSRWGWRSPAASSMVKHWPVNSAASQPNRRSAAAFTVSMMPLSSRIRMVSAACSISMSRRNSARRPSVTSIRAPSHTTAPSPWRRGLDAPFSQRTSPDWVMARNSSMHSDRSVAERWMASRWASRSAQCTTCRQPLELTAMASGARPSTRSTLPLNSG